MTRTPATRPEGFRLISFVSETDADLLPHFVRWYRRLGVERFHLAMHGTSERETFEWLADVACSRAMQSIAPPRTPSHPLRPCVNRGGRPWAGPDGRFLFK